jgi:ABC-type sugar transport system permease subunit
MKSFQIPLRIFAILFIIAIAWFVRAHAVGTLPHDYDEDDYLRAAQEYTHLVRTSDWHGFQETNYRPEHPPLAKILMGLSLLSSAEEELTPDAPTTAQPNQDLPETLVHSARTLNAILGVLTVALLTIIDPIAGLSLALHSFTIKYVSQVMLEALPALTSLVTAFAYLQYKKHRSTNFWLITSAVFLGFTAASKYLYCVVAFAILTDWFFEAKYKNDLKRFYKQAMLWGVLALVIFFAADPFLWPHPAQRLQESVFYHAGYSTGAAEVQNAGYPFWQPFVWITASPAMWSSDSFLLAPDFFITVFAFLGLRRLWRRERLYVLWLFFAWAFLLLWPTKWPQYILIFTVPLSLSASQGIQLTWGNAVEWFRNQRAHKTIHDKKETRRAMPWLVPGLIAFAILTIFPLIFQFAVSTTDFNSSSIRDGINGGIWRAVWEGITGQVEITNADIDTRSNQVNFVGLSSYPDVFIFVSGRGTLFFDIFWTILSVTMQLALGLFVALLLWQRGVKLGKFWQTLFILPWAIPEVIGALMWLNIFNPERGWLALGVKAFGSSMPFAFLNGWEKTSNLWLLIYLLPAIWYGFPFMMLAASAGLKMIPKEVYDAAAIDGADIWQAFRYVTWPLILPLLFPAIIVRGIFAFNQFYLFQVFGYGDATLASLSYNVFNPSGRFAISAIINILTVLILIVFVMLFNRWSRAEEGLIHA